MLLLNLLLALAWMALTGQFTPLNFAAGFLFAYVILRLLRLPGEPKTYFQRAILLAHFAIFYLKELLLANIRVAAIVLSPQLEITPAIVAIPLEVKSEMAISLLANLITLTPGSLTLDISEDCQVLYVHTMHTNDIDQFRLDIKELERRVLEVTQ